MSPAAFLQLAQICILPIICFAWYSTIKTTTYLRKLRHWGLLLNKWDFLSIMQFTPVL